MNEEGCSSPQCSVVVRLYYNLQYFAFQNGQFVKSGFYSRVKAALCCATPQNKAVFIADVPKGLNLKQVGFYPFLQATQALRVSRGIALLFSMIFGTRWGWGFSPTSRPPLPPGKTRYPLYRRLGGPQGRAGRVKNLVPTGIRSRTVQPVVSRYID